jgi:polyisoprenoid-binding protein YceI
MTTSTTTEIPGFVAGTWTIDPVHSEVGFWVRHMMVSKVRGKFNTFSGELVTTSDPLKSSVTAEIELESVDTNNSQRDNHIRSADFFEVEANKVMTYRSTGIRVEDGEYILDGELTLKGVTKSVPLTLELNGFGKDPYGGTRAGFSAQGEIHRSDFGVTFGLGEGGGTVVSDKVNIQLEVEAVLAS